MKVALISNADYDPNTGVSGTRIAFRDSLRSLGVQADTFFMDDLKSFSGGLLDRIIFPWKIALVRKKWEEYDVVDIASGDSWVISSMVKRPKTVFSSHGLEHLAHQEILKESRSGNIELSWKYPIYWGGYRLWEVSRSIMNSDVSIFLNKNDRDYAISKIGLSPDKAHIVPNGVPDYFLNRTFRKNNRNNSVIKVAQVGSYIPRKGIKYTSMVMNKLLKKYQNVELTFFGTGCEDVRIFEDYEPEIRNKIKVVSKYKHSELPSLLEEFHINLFPSLSEGFGKTLIESMACGLAPIAFETPGPIDIITHQYDGLIAPRRNVDLLQKHIETLINNPTLLDNIQHNAYTTAQKYSWKQAAKYRLVAYEEALNHQKRAVLLR
ncbi:glycosyltransferase family 4 protein [Niallia circulans]|uniref:glycosyltransferase family 4 protein n=1 Tax=Niallia circulans TaxID=1397 RepID=UPI0014901E31|nr:glycosyltransferase family 4 protein [Niallia circulans]QJX64182.1 glycosyltransferase family 4 protein [Niallia circulans]